MFDVDDTAPDTPAPRELSQDVQALIMSTPRCLTVICHFHAR